jgi:hypothetical protein
LAGSESEKKFGFGYGFGSREAPFTKIVLGFNLNPTANCGSESEKNYFGSTILLLIPVAW